MPKIIKAVLATVPEEEKNRESRASMPEIEEDDHFHERDKRLLAVEEKH